MEINEIKKALYKAKPKLIAKRSYKQRGGGLNGNVEDYDRYMTYVDSLDKAIVFIVPVKEQGEIPFEDEVPAQLLIRWLTGIDAEPLI